MLTDDSNLLPPPGLQGLSPTVNTTGGGGVSLSDKKKAYMKAWRAKNREHELAYGRAYNAKRPKEKKKVANRASYCRHRESRLAKEKEFRRKHPEVKKQRDAAYYKANADKIKSRTAGYYHANKVVISKRVSAFYETHKAEFAAYKKEHLRKNPAYYRMESAKRKALKLKVSIGNIEVISAWQEAIRASRVAVCFWCLKKITGSEVEFDHIVALSKGGSHSVENLCVSCKLCNGKKYTKSLVTWNNQIESPVLI